MSTAASSSSFGNITDYIESLNLDEATRCALLHKLCGLREQGLNIMITGATGSGKSSTINALFRADKARVGEGASPETQQIARYDFDGMTIWDTPGLGDGDEADRRHTEAIESKLRETGPDGKPLIDAVLVILEAGSRDLGTSYKLINEIVMPLLDDHKRLVVAINQADMALKGRHWDYDANQPDATLLAALDEMAAVVRKRIAASTGVDVEPVFYCAGYRENGVQMPPYNLAKLLAAVLRRLPTGKRLLVAENMNRSRENYTSDDGRADYREEVVSAFREACRDVGEAIGNSLFGKTGGAVGRMVGDVVGRIGDWISSWF